MMLREYFSKKIYIFLLLPVLVILISITILPTIYLFYVSLCDFNIKTQFVSQFVGLINYQRLFHDYKFWTSLRITAVFSAAAVFFEFLIGLCFALLLSRENLKFQGVFLALFITPMVITPVVVGLLWRIMYDPTLGIFNYLIQVAGFPKLEWLGRSNLALLAIIVTDTWQWTPFLFLMIFAGLQTIPVELFEVAEVEGASAINRFWYITLPMLRQIILVAILFRTIDVLKTFDIIYMMTKGGPGHATENINMHTYLLMFRYLNFGYGSAKIVVMLFIVLGICTVFMRLIGKRFVEV